MAVMTEERAFRRSWSIDVTYLNTERRRVMMIDIGRDKKKIGGIMGMVVVKSCY